MNTAINAVSTTYANRSRLATTLLAEVMTTNPRTIGIGAPRSEAYDAMRAQGIRHLPVLENGRLAGLLSQSDLFHDELVHGGRDATPTIASAMTRAPFVVAPRDCVGAVAQTMAERHCSCAVVVDGHGVVGVFTAMDALRLVAELFGT